jgi:hypothetical protein
VRRPLGSHRGPMTRLWRLVCWPCCSTPTTLAVSQAAAGALFQRGDIVAVGLVAAAFEVADEDAKNKPGDCLYDEQGTRWSTDRSILNELRCHEAGAGGLAAQLFGNAATLAAAAAAAAVAGGRASLGWSGRMAAASSP